MEQPPAGKVDLHAGKGGLYPFAMQKADEPPAKALDIAA
jgi:hypothetical protein